MNLELLRLLFDFGLLVLIWLVQLVVYPSFQFYTKEGLLKWHRKYKGAISLVVIPLMFGQLITATLQLTEECSPFTIGGLFLIILVWAITFVQFVPMHGKIGENQVDEDLLRKLVHRNWWRTILWTILFIWSCFRLFTN